MSNRYQVTLRLNRSWRSNGLIFLAGIFNSGLQAAQQKSDYWRNGVLPPISFRSKDILYSNDKLKGLIRVMKLVVLLGLILVNQLAVGQLAAVSIPQLDQAKINLDGDLDEPEWQRAYVVDLEYEIFPADNGKANYQTKAYLFFTQDTLYFAAEALDPEPEQIRAQLRERDRNWEDDTIHLFLDTYNHNKSAYHFSVNPLGSQSDSIVSSSGNGDHRWNGVWKSAGKITAHGYRVELALPIALFKYDSDKLTQEWGLGIERQVPRGEGRKMSQVKRDKNNSCFECQYQDTKLEGDIKQTSRIELLPYITYHRSREQEYPYNDGGIQETEFDGGVDVKWDISSNTTLAATVNPDFSQVDVDNIQFNINERFALYYGEKRPFFLESSNFFNSRINLLHTRNIAKPDYGVKLTAKIGRHSTGVFVADDEATAFVLPGLESSSLIYYDKPSLNGAARYQYDWDDDFTIGTMATFRQADEYSNIVWAADGRYKPTKSHSFQGQLAFSASDYSDVLQQEYELPDSLNGSAFTLSHDYDSKHFTSYTNYSQTGADFRAELGFINQVGVRKLYHHSQYIFHGINNGWWNRWRLNASYFRKEAIGGEMLNEEVSLFTGLAMANESYAHLRITQQKANYQGQQYDLTQFDGYFQYRPHEKISHAFWFWNSDRIDYSKNRPADSHNFGTSINYQPFSGLELGFNIDKNIFEVDDGELFNTLSIRLSANFHFNLSHHLKLIAQYAKVEQNSELYDDPVNEFSKDSVYQLTYHYLMNAKAALYVGYNASAAQDPTFNGQWRQSRDFFFTKLSYNF